VFSSTSQLSSILIQAFDQHGNPVVSIKERREGGERESQEKLKVVKTDGSL
jgi:hypothetical protein